LFLFLIISSGFLFAASSIHCSSCGLPNLFHSYPFYPVFLLSFYLALILYYSTGFAALATAFSMQLVVPPYELIVLHFRTRRCCLLLSLLLFVVVLASLLFLVFVVGFVAFVAWHCLTA